MSMELDIALVHMSKRRRRPDGLTAKEVMAINWFWRKNVKVSVLAKVFGVSKNTIYYKCLTGEADSYPVSRINSAAATNDLFETLGPDEVERRFVTKKMKKAINAAMKQEVEL